MRAAIALACALLIVGCGGGGGGGSAGGGPGPGSQPVSQPVNGPEDFVLQSAYLARPIIGLDGALQQLLNPASLYEVDPLTGVAQAGYPKALIPGTSLNELTVINFAQILDPITPQVPLVPRNAAIVLEFSFPVAVESLMLDNSDPGAPGKLTVGSPLQVVRADGSLVAARAAVDGRKVALFAQSQTQVGWEASPLVFDTFGNAVEDPSGHLSIVMGSGVGLVPFTSTSGAELVPRLPDHLGSVAAPFPFNPGNSKLDPLALQTDDGPISFNGFLPDLTAPRIVRPVVLESQVDVGGKLDSLTVRGQALANDPNTVANGGLGEWAGALLEIVVGGNVTRCVVESSSADANVSGKPIYHLTPDTPLPSGSLDNAAYTVTRTEFYEPIPPPLPGNPAALADITVDPVLHPRDPLDAQDLINHDLRFFVRMYDEVDDINDLDDDAEHEQIEVWNPAEDLFGPVKGKFGSVPARTTLRIQFSEPMEPSSFRSFETFYVTESSVPKTDPALQRQRVGRCVASTDLRTLAFEPFLEDQFDAQASEYIGFGGTPTSLKLVLRTLPEPAQLTALLAGASPQQKAQFFDLDTEGVLGVIDLGGRGLGLPPAMLDASNPNFFLLQPASPGRGAYPPAIDASVSFQTQPSEDPDFGAIVHRFMGQATSSSFTYPDPSVHDEVTTGVEYHDWPPEDVDHNGTVDRRFIYGPKLLDIGLNLPGRLTGSPANTIEHVVDDFNRPKPAPFSSPQGQDFLPTIGFGVTLPLNSPFGCRFQHIFRQGEASPAFHDFNGVVLDLVGLAWSPLISSASTLTNETIENMSILVGLSATNNTAGPNTNQNLGIPSGENTGLDRHFDCNLLDWRDVCCIAKTNVPAELMPFVESQPKLTEVVRRGTQYTISSGKLFKPGNALNKPAGQFNLYLNYPTFNTGVDTTFGKTDVNSFPYDSRFPMIVEYHIEPAVNTFPSNANPYRFSPGIFSSVLPRFRVWSQGQHPLANCVASFFTGCPPGCGFKAGEGGPLLEPGSYPLPVKPPFPKNNQMPTQFPSAYILPPKTKIPNTDICEDNQPAPDAVGGTCPGAPTMEAPCGDPVYVPPTCNSDPAMNWYYANGMRAFPLPDLAMFPGPTGAPSTAFYGFGPGGPPFQPNPPCPQYPVGLLAPFINEPGYECSPSSYGDNSRYYMMWKYRKRVSHIESPTIEAQPGQFGLLYRHPIIDPPLATVSEAAGLRIEFRSSTQLDFATPQLASTDLLPTDPNFQAELSGSNFDRVFVKFKATFAVAAGQLQPPSIDTIVIPYQKIDP